MAGGVAPFIGRKQRIDVIRRIRNNQIEFFNRIVSLHRDRHCIQTVRPGRRGKIFSRLRRTLHIDIHRRNPSSTPLGQHQGDQARARTYVEHPPVPGTYFGPGTEQHPVGSDLHRAAILPHGKLFEPEHGYPFRKPSIPAPNSAKS